MPVRQILSFGIAALLASAVPVFAQSGQGGASQRTPAPGHRTGSRNARWVGVSFGVNVGVSSASFSGPVTLAAFTGGGTQFPESSITFSPAGVTAFAIGGQAGFAMNAGPVIVGVEGDFGGGRPSVTKTADTDANGEFIPQDSFTARSKFEMSARVRIGVPRDKLFVYGTGGLAMNAVEMTGTFPPVSTFPAAAGSDSHLLTGFVFGGGAAYAIMDNVNIGAEFRRVMFAASQFNLGDLVVFMPPNFSEPALANLKLVRNEFSVRVNIKVK